MKGRVTISITIHDIAQRVGVSPKTVSRAMNNHPGVSEATRTAVLQAIQDLGFRPNAAARGLRKGRTGIIGALVPDLRNPHYAEYIYHLQQVANDAGYMLVVSNTNYDQTLSLAHLSTLIDHRADAVLWLSGTLDQTLITFIRETRLPIVVVDTIPPEGIDHVRCLLSYPARDRTTYAMTTQLITLGHTRFAYIAQGTAQIVEYSRIAAFRQALQDHHIPAEAGVVKSHVSSQFSHAESGYRAMNDVLETGYRPTAVCTLTDLLAIGVLRSLREHGLRVPEDVSVVGCDDIIQAAFTDPPLTTIGTPYLEISRAMLKMAQQMIEPQKIEKTEVKPEIEYRLIQRASVAKAPSPHVEIIP